MGWKMLRRLGRRSVESVSNGVRGVRDESYEEVGAVGFAAKVLYECLPKGDGCAP
jgi:hypothetical protein